MPGRRRLSLMAWLVAIAPVAALADEPPADSLERDYAADLPRVAPVEPDAALATFTIKPPFRLELVAAEPLVADPVAAAFDADGRLYVVEMRGYSQERDERLSRVRLLEDTDADGRMDRAATFADQLLWPTAVACFDGGVFVADPPDLLYLKDTDGDGQADERRVVFTGFGLSNVQGLVNSLHWGLDNRVHGATGTVGAELRVAGDPSAKPLNLRGRDFSFDPRTLDLAATSGGAQHGMSFDDWGRKFVSSNSDHLQQVMYEDRYVARNPYLNAPPSRKSIAADGPQAEVFRLSPVEPWRVIRTRLRAGGIVPGKVEGGGRAAGYFTGATGATIYRGHAWPDELRGMAIIGDVGSNIVHRKRLEPAGLEFVARRVDEASELVASIDIWFRPAQFLNAPDGSLHILDVYREVIEHPDSLPPVLKRHLDLTSGRDRGRIYRLIPDDFSRPEPPRLTSAGTAELVALLEHPSGWWRETAARLLYERQDTAAIAPLRRLASESPSPLARMHALYALAGLNALAPTDARRALTDPHPRVREHAVKLSEGHLPADSTLSDALAAMTGDDDLGVRYQLAFSLGELPLASRVGPLLTLARRDAGDPWMRLAIQSSLAFGAAEVFVALAQDDTARRGAGAHALLAALAAQIGRQGRAADVAAAAATLESLAARGDEQAATLAESFVQGLVAARGSRAIAYDTNDHPRLSRLVNERVSTALKTAGDERRSEADRVAAIAALGLAEWRVARDALAPLLDGRQPRRLQSAALETLSSFSEPAVAEVILAAWPSLSPGMRAAAVELIFSRAERVAAMLDAIEDGRVSVADIDPARLRWLAESSDAALAKRAAKLLDSRSPGSRQEVVEAYRAALDLPGDAVKGKAIFDKNCSACHRLDGLGVEIGPNLATAASRGAEALVLNILDPSREVNPQYANYLVQTVDGRALSGMIAAESATSLTLRRAQGMEDTILRVDIEELRGAGLSLMPEGLERQIDPQDMADLLAFLLSPR